MDGSNIDFQISPETKIGALLDKFPGLEKTLLEMAPEFKKLRNPILRKTIARVTSLRQASAVAKIPLAEMINKLRNEAGIHEEFMSDEAIESLSKEIPSWFSTARIVQSLDARPMLERGEQPINRVFNESKNLKSGEIYELITPFLPAPLIDTAKEKGYLTWSKNEGEEVFKTYLTPKT
ncbi:MAG: DUF1858 domain-containing protein [Candidatus Aminicenantes bacterium]|nr:MAG: DUF1858 domain-containing protein [Candidatus Aminicenantes bacterium]